jgi:methyltransferase (TIGR00027 family)
VILGAGLDTFAYRQPVWGSLLTIYEVDHPITQRWKQERLNAAEIETPPNLKFVPIDFERAPIVEALRAKDFGFEMPTVCSWMGVTQYLTRDALDATFQFVLSLAPLSEVIFSFILPQEEVSGVEAEALAIAAQRAADVGEQWLTRLSGDDLATKLRSMGFSRIIHLKPEEARQRYFDGRRDGLTERRGEQLMRAIV